MTSGRPVHLGLLGRSVRIESTDAELVRGLAGCYASSSEPIDAADPDLHVALRRRAASDGDHESVEVETLPLGVLEAAWPWAFRSTRDVCSALNAWAASQDSPYYVFHAGVVERDGLALLLPGASGSGKSTITAGLLRRGFGLLSDEVAAIDRRTGRVVAYPRLLSLRHDVLDLFGVGDGNAGTDSAAMVAPEELGGSRAKEARSVALVLAPCFRVGSPLCLEKLSTAGAVMELMASSVTHARTGVEGLDWVIEHLGRLPAFRLSFSNLAEAVDAIEALWHSSGGAAQANRDVTLGE